MQIKARYSHLNGEEYLLVRRQALWEEVQEVIARVDASACRTKISREKTMRGRLLYSPQQRRDTLEGVVMTNMESLRYLVTETAGATLSDAEWAQLEAQAEGLQAGLKALDALDLSAAEPAVVPAHGAPVQAERWLTPPQNIPFRP